MICNHYVFVSTSRSDRESVTIISVEFTNGLIPYVQFLVFFYFVEYPLLLTVSVVCSGLVSFDCCLLDVYFSWWISLLVKIVPYVLLESPLSVGNI